MGRNLVEMLHSHVLQKTFSMRLAFVFLNLFERLSIMSNIRIHVVSSVHPADQKTVHQSVLIAKILIVEHYAQILQPFCFHSCLPMSNNDLLSCILCHLHWF